MRLALNAFFQQQIHREGAIFLGLEFPDRDPSIADIVRIFRFRVLLSQPLSFLLAPDFLILTS